MLFKFFSLASLHPFFPYPFFTHSCSHSSFWSFSATRRLVTASQRLLFRWKYRRRSSFLVSTPQNKSKDENSPKGCLYCGEKVSVWIVRILRTKTLPYVFICFVCHGRAGDSISRVPCTCSYKLIKMPCPPNFLRQPCFFIICGTW